jgi:citrate lyase subunit alpha/citrate CoA-transferase
MKDSSLPIKSIKQIRDEVYEICGGAPAKPKVNKNKVIAVVKWVDGTLLDSVFQIVS